MHRTVRFHVITALALMAVVLVAAAATAAKPKAGRYADVRSTRIVASFIVKKGKVKTFSAFPKCAPVPAEIPAMKVKRGKFSFKGKVEDLIGTKLRVSISGKFTTKTKAKGSFKYTKTGCDDSRKRFTAKHQ